MDYAAPLPHPVPTRAIGFYGDIGHYTGSQHNLGGRYDSEQIKQEQALVAAFQLLVDEWLENTAHISSITEMVSDPAYLEIIGKGPQALPYLIRELERAPNHWFVALAAITGENPVEDHQRGNVLEMTHAWLEWARKEG